MARHASRPIGPRLFLGLLIIALGVGFTLDNLGLVDFDHLLRYWPVVFLIVAVAKLLGGEWIGALGWAALGGILMIPIFDPRTGYEDLWPVVLIFLGLRLVFRALGPKRAEGEAAPRVSSFAFMSTSRQAVVSDHFEGGDLTAVMGGCELDLREAEIADEVAVIDAFAFWGGVEIRIPEHWSLDLRVLPLMGGAEDKTRGSRATSGPCLRVTGVALMGGVEIHD